jgi:extracellular factor (EF) 3-hydroxypalmitic acid methyl ester biosynthesis protein
MLARPEITEEVCSALDAHHERFLKAPCVGTLKEMVQELDRLHDIAAQSGALPEFRKACQAHPLHRLVLHDPYTERAFRKPRGYAGDAVMLDYIYRPGRVELAGTAEVVHSLTTRSSPAESILWRRDRLGDEISKIVNRARSARILSVASGHLRELDVVRARVNHRNFAIVALDQDRDSLQEAINSNTDFNITPVDKSISHILKGDDSSKYDLIYSAGLFDYLEAKLASALLSQLLTMLSPSGKLLLGNYAPEIYGRGYMEGMMSWSLLYRNEADLEALDTSRNVYRDEPGNVVYVDISPD